jgi:hypothetical protein
VETGLEQIAPRALKEAKPWFTSLAHHIKRDRVWQNLFQIPSKSAPGINGRTVVEAKRSFKEWIEPMLQSMHRKGYRAPVNPAGVYPQAWQTANAVAWRTLGQRSCSATQLGPDTVSRL